MSETRCYLKITLRFWVLGFRGRGLLPARLFTPGPDSACGIACCWKAGSKPGFLVRCAGVGFGSLVYFNTCLAIPKLRFSFIHLNLGDFGGGGVGGGRAGGERGVGGGGRGKGWVRPLEGPTPQCRL